MSGHEREWRIKTITVHLLVKLNMPEGKIKDLKCCCLTRTFNLYRRGHDVEMSKGKGAVMRVDRMVGCLYLYEEQC